MRHFIIVVMLLAIFPLKAEEMSAAKRDAETLMSSVTGTAEQMLREHGEFFPYGGAMKPGGEIVSVSGYTGDEHPPSQEIIDLLTAALGEAARAGEYKATAIVYDVKVSVPENESKSDAIAVALDHRDGYSVVVFFPYTLVDGELSYGALFAQQGADRMFKNTDETPVSQ